MLESGNISQLDKVSEIGREGLTTATSWNQGIYPSWIYVSEIGREGLTTATSWNQGIYPSWIK